MNCSGRKLSAQLRAKIRSLDEYTTGGAAPGGVATPRKTTYVVSNNAPNAPSSAGPLSPGVAAANVIHNELHGAGDDAKSLHSDSSLSDVTSGETASRRIPQDDHKPAVPTLSLFTCQLIGNHFFKRRASQFTH